MLRSKKRATEDSQASFVDQLTGMSSLLRDSHKSRRSAAEIRRDIIRLRQRADDNPDLEARKAMLLEAEKLGWEADGLAEKADALYAEGVDLERSLTTVANLKVSTDTLRAGGKQAKALLFATWVLAFATFGLIAATIVGAFIASGRL